MSVARARRNGACAVAVLVVACGHHDTGAGASVAAPHPRTGPETDCASCHPRHVEEWKGSSHAYAMRDPVFQAMVKVGQRDTRGELGEFCVQCHSPIGTATGVTKVSKGSDGTYFQPIDGLGQSVMDGVSCITCHSITKVNSTANADFEMQRDGVRGGPIVDPDPNSAHPSEGRSIFDHSSICGTCHVVVNPNNVALERTHIEWVQSAFNGAQSCQDCHMPKYSGPAAVGHKARTVHEHTFVGADVSLLPAAEFPAYDELRARSDDLLKSSVSFTVNAEPAARRLAVGITNLAGHALPSGATADREMWLEVIVRDASGAVVLESGTPDERGDLRVANADRTTRPGTDPTLVLYSQKMVFDPKIPDPASTEPPRQVDFLWEPNAEVTNIISVAGVEHPTYDLSTLPPGPYRASARLLFRSFPPHLLRKLEGLAGLDPEVGRRVPTVEMASSTVEFTLQ
jgi:hypothetical protein